jgi:hypothetical protein
MVCVTPGLSANLQSLDRELVIAEAMHNATSIYKTPQAIALLGIEQCQGRQRRGRKLRTLARAS